MVEQVARTGALLALLLAASACSDDPVGTSSSTSSGATGTGGGGGEGGAGGAGGGTATTTTGSTGGAGGEGGMGGTGGEGGGEAPGAVGVAGQPCATPGDKACAGHAQATKLICGEDHLWTAAGDCPASERCTSASLPSMPSTSRAVRAIGSVKLPRPQNQSITRSCGCTSSRRSARDTSTLLIWWFTWVKSVGLKGITMPNSASV